MGIFLTTCCKKLKVSGVRCQVVEVLKIETCEISITVSYNRNRFFFIK